MDTEQGERPKGDRRPESGAEDTVNTHEAEVSEENKAGWRVWITGAAAVGACPERDGGNSSIGQEPGRPGSPAPKALESGRTHRPNKATERLAKKPPRVEVTIPTRRKHANTAKARPRKPRPGEQREEKRNVSQSKCFPKSEGRNHRRNGEWPMERHDRYDSVPSQNLQENSQARFIQLHTPQRGEISRWKDGADSERHREGEAREDLHKPAEIPHIGKSRRGQDNRK